MVNQTAHKAQMVHNQAVRDVEVKAIAADEFWSFVEKNNPMVRRGQNGAETAGAACVWSEGAV